MQVWAQGIPPVDQPLLEGPLVDQPLLEGPLVDQPLVRTCQTSKTHTQATLKLTLQTVTGAVTLTTATRI